MINLKDKYIKKAFKWIDMKDGSGFLNDDEYCETRDVFNARLVKLRSLLSNNEISYVVVAIAGEIGNNSFDHNIGEWRDVPGIYFKLDEKNSNIILADRGQGIRKTIGRVYPVKNDLEALKTAFLKNISGRAPEHRGNGLWFVLDELKKNKNMMLYLYSGTAVIEFIDENNINFKNSDVNIRGCLAILNYSL